MYHTFDADEENIRKQKKQEEADRQTEAETTTDKANAHNATYGAANLSLKHLLAAIESKQDELSITESELSTLLSDVRKNRSKWASEDKIGQEELYEAAEKVVLQLRGTTEHSTAFLNKVNKRDAPNYFNIIKRPMDLNTVMKRLKSFHYKSKTEFVDDLMVIWHNCLKYNADPNHFLRVHANAMRAKTLQLIPLIPDIKVRDRAEVEAEEARLVKEEADSEDDDKDKQQPKAGARIKGLGGKHAAKGRKRKLQHEEAPGAGSRASPFPRLESVEASATPATGTPGPSNEYDEEQKYETAEVDFNDIEALLYQELFGEKVLALCMQRSDLFKGNRLQIDRPALLRSGLGMARFEESELDAYKSEEAHCEAKQERRSFNRGFISSMEDSDDILVEYSTGIGLPSVSWEVSSHNKNEGLGDVSLENIGESGYVNRTGLAPSYLSNLQEMQHIRKICFKIGVIRQMQQQAYMHATQLKPYIPEVITEPDLDLESRLPNRDKYDEDASRIALRRNIAKISMHTGFEDTELMAVDALTEVAADYMSKLGRSLKMWMESNEPSNAFTFTDVITNVLEEHGIESISSLDTYIQNDIERQNQRLVEQKKKLAVFVGDLLRPGSSEMNDNEFKDGSDQFITGDFSEELGDDFFGFKELGLDQEFGLTSMSVPLHLLQSRFALASMNNTVADSHEHNTRVPDYPDIDKDVAEHQIGPVRTFLLKRFEITSATTLSDDPTEAEIAAAREANATADADANAAGVNAPPPKHLLGSRLILLEGDQLPAKLRNSRPKVPPTGKLAGVKKKQPSKIFYRPPPPVWVKKPTPPSLSSQPPQSQSQQQRHPSSSSSSQPLSRHSSSQHFQQSQGGGGGGFQDEGHFKHEEDLDLDMPDSSSAGNGFVNGNAANNANGSSKNDYRFMLPTSNR